MRVVLRLVLLSQSISKRMRKCSDPSSWAARADRQPVPRPGPSQCSARSSAEKKGMGSLVTMGQLLKSLMQHPVRVCSYVPLCKYEQLHVTIEPLVCWP